LNGLKKLLTKYLPLVLITALAFTLTNRAEAQSRGKEKIVQLSGLVMTADSSDVVRGVNIYNPYNGRGTYSDIKGWFSWPFVAGDTVLFSVIGYKNRQIVIPEDAGDRYTIIMALEEEIVNLPDVEINPFPTEEIFKEAIMAMNLTEQQENVLRSFEPSVVQEMVRTMPIEGSADLNYRYMMNQQFQNLQYSSGPRTNPLLNPFAWSQFIKSLKKKKKK